MVRARLTSQKTSCKLNAMNNSEDLNMTESDTKRYIFRGGLALVCLAVLALLAPVISAAVSAGLGLLGLAVIAVVGFAALQMMPWLGQKLENTVLKMRKAEARANPIEQLQNFLRQKAQAVADFKAAVATIGAQIKSLEDMVRDRKRQRPGYDATAQERSIQAMKDAHTVLVTKYTNAEQALSELRVAIQDKEFEWKFSQAGQAAMKTLNATSGKELMEAMLADEAFSSVTDNFNKVFAELEMEAQHLTTAKQLEFSPGMVIDVSDINLTKVPA